MSDSPDQDPPARPGGGVAGAVLLTVGLVLLAVVLAADVGGPPALERLAFALGLALAPLMEAFGIALTLIGGWMAWRARRG